MTSVEWLFEKINDALIDFTENKISASEYGIRVTEYRHQAKEMYRKEQEKLVDEAITNYEIGWSDRKEQLPQQEISDEEIEKESNYLYVIEDEIEAFIQGANWMQEQLKL
jgi:hypothetical protein